MLEDKFDISPPIHVGQVATAYPAIQKGLERRVLLKVLHPQFATDSELVERFNREGKAMAQIDHPNVVRVYDCGREEGAPYLALEWVEGETLKERLAGGPLPSSEVGRLARDVLQGLAAVHREKLLHRDLKPDNILLDATGRARLADFSLAWFARSPALTAHGALVGSPAYMAPELLEGRQASPASDLYALGVILLEALTGSNPFAASDPLASLELVRTQKAPRLTGNPRLEPSLARLVDSLLEREPADRPAGAEAALRLWEGEPVPAPGIRRRFPLRRAVATVAITAAIALAVLWLREPEIRRMTENAPESTGGLDTLEPMALPDTKAMSYHSDESWYPATPAVTSAPRDSNRRRNDAKPSSPVHSQSSAPIPQTVGTLTIIAQPWAEVWLNGKPLGITPLGKLELPAGRYELLFKHNLYPEIVRETDVRTGGRDTLTVDLAAEAARLTVTADPWGYLWLDDDSLGLLPRSDPLWLKPGMYKLLVQHPQLPMFADSLSLNAGERLTLRVNLLNGTKIATTNSKQVSK